MDARKSFRLTTVGVAVLAAMSPVFAAEPEPAPAAAPASAPAAELDPARPVSEVRAGLGYASNDGRNFGQYNGINEDGFYGLFDFSIVRRKDETGTWLRFEGRNIGLDSRQIRFENNRQGNWGYFIEYGSIPRFEPYTATSAVTGIGSPNLTVPAVATTGVPFDLKTKREAVGLGFDKILWGAWDVSVRFKNEEKDGERLFARGNNLGPAPAGFNGHFEFTPEPIKSTTRQLEVLLGYTGERLQLSGGYYGTMYNNKYSQMDIAGGNPALPTPLALPPDNHAHQFHLSGGYGFTPTTRGTFKVAYANARQDDAFATGAGVPLAPGVGNNLQAKVDTTFAQAGIVSRPIPKLTLRADFKYDDRDDKTPLVQFFPPGGGTTTGYNEPRSIRTTKGMAEASYLLPYELRLTGGLEREEKKRNTSDVRVVSYRETTEETSYRAELRRSMSETLTGAVAYVYSDRDGSPFMTNTLVGGALGSNLIAPLHLADRKRDKVRVSSTWMPIAPLSIQAFIDWADDRYSGRDGSGLGPRKGEARNYSLDAAYTFSEKWQGNAWYNRNEARADQTTCDNASGTGACPTTAVNPVYSASVRNVSDSFGLGLRGKPSPKLEVGGDLSYSDIKDTYSQAPVAPAASAAAAPLPDITTRLTRFNLFAKYALEKASGVRLDYVFDRFRTDDWTWTGFVYLDGTRLSQDPNQKVHFIGVSYYYRWQ